MLPDVFRDAAEFEAWFDFEGMVGQEGGKEKLAAMEQRDQVTGWWETMGWETHTHHLPTPNTGCQQAAPPAQTLCAAPFEIRGGAIHARKDRDHPLRTHERTAKAAQQPNP